jgi:hypothetical protein
MILHSFIAKKRWQFGNQELLNNCLLFGYVELLKRSLAILQQPIAKHMLAILATFYRLNRNDRVSSFYWTKGSKQYFLT